MPCGLHLDGVEYPIRVFALLGEPVGLGQRVVEVALEVRRHASLELRGDFRHARAIQRLTTQVLGHSIVYGTSDNSTSWYDNRLARHIGYRPQDSADVFREAVHARTPEPDPKDPVVQFQGGGFLRLGPF